jgi:class 3 adenylate cyclase/uncharacterized membrane protein YgdD (TMEM256/DUF423 family)
MNFSIAPGLYGRLAVVIVSIATIAAAAWIGSISGFDGPLSPLSGPNGVLYDLSAALSARGTVSNPWRNTVILLVDEPTLAEPPWSWTPRALQHPQLANLAREALESGARKVGFDLVVALDPSQLKLSDANLAAYDADFRDLLDKNAERIILGAYPTVQPAEAYADIVGPQGVGIVDLQTEKDGIVRSAATRLRLPGGRGQFGFAQLLATIDNNIEVPSASRILIFPKARIDEIPHFSAGHFESCFASAEGRAHFKDLMKDRVVIIAAGIAGEDTQRGPDEFMGQGNASHNSASKLPCGEAHDRLSGPVESHRLPGAFLQAAAVENALSPQSVELADKPERAFANAYLAAIAMALLMATQRGFHGLPLKRSWMFATSLRTGLALITGIVVLSGITLAIEVGTIRFAHLWLPLGHTLVLLAGWSLLGTMTIAIRRDLALADLRVVFGRWLPPPVVEATLSPVRKGQFGGEERTITVLMADLRGFTNFCETRRDQPTEIINALNHKFGAAQTVLDKYEGCLDKFDGDAVIAFWNGIGDQPDHAARAIAAAIEIIDRQARFAAEIPGLEFKVAIATGLAFVGAYGSKQKTNFSAIGEPMNLAARLETLCNRYGIDIALAESTVASAAINPARHEGAKNLLSQKSFVQIDVVTLKGFAAAMPFFTVSAKEPETVKLQ